MGDVDQNITKDIYQPGRNKEIDWSDITASCASGEHVILGFGNGALVCYNTQENVPQNEAIKKLDLNFTGAGDKPIDKLKLVHMDVMKQIVRNGA